MTRVQRLAMMLWALAHAEHWNKCWGEAVEAARCERDRRCGKLFGIGDTPPMSARVVRRLVMCKEGHGTRCTVCHDTRITEGIAIVEHAQTHYTLDQITALELPMQVKL